MDFLELIKNLKKDYSSFPVHRLALVSDVSTQFAAKALRAEAYEAKINLEIFEAGLGLAEREILDPESSFHSFHSETVIFHLSFPEKQKAFYRLNKELRKNFVRDVTRTLREQITFLNRKFYNRILICTLPELKDDVYGDAGMAEQQSFSYAVRQINQEIFELCSSNTSCKVAGIHHLVSQYGYENYFDPQFFYTATADISLKALPRFAKLIISKLKVQAGQIKKCIVLDLDNTLWGGIAGDDGWENLETGNLGKGKTYQDLQYWLKEMSHRGILLAVCSKNDENTAREVFIKNPDMILKLSDFAAFTANWNSKSDNLLIIRDMLNIGLESMVFLDDNAFEREQVRQAIPEITIPDLPADVSRWLPYITSLDLFGFDRITDEDRDRNQFYQQSASRKSEAAGHGSLNEYLKSLQMISILAGVSNYDLPRAAQLTQRTNQFNLRTVRYSEAELAKKLALENYTGFTASLEDKFGNEGIVSFVLLETTSQDLFIDTWVMSCRVFGRGLEHLIFSEIVKKARQLNLPLRAEYLPTPKNKFVENLLPEYGFQKESQFYVLQTAKAVFKEHFINPVSRLFH